MKIISQPFKKYSVQLITAYAAAWAMLPQEWRDSLVEHQWLGFIMLGGLFLARIISQEA